MFRHVLKSGAVASRETRAKTATVRGERLRGHTINERVQLRFSTVGLVTDGRPVSSQGLRAGGAPDLAQNDATDDELEEAGRWGQGASIPRTVYNRPAQKAKRDPFDKVPVHNPAAAED